MAAGVVAGATAGLGSRLIMFAIRLMNPTYNGVPTHANAEVGRFTLEGTLGLAAEGAFYGLPGAVVYLVVRRWLPGEGVVKGAAYGGFLLVVAAPVVLNGDYEFFRYVPAWVSVGLFALLYPLYGIVVAPLTEGLGNGAQGRPANAGVAWSGYAVIAGLLVWGLVRDVVLLRDVFHLLG